MKKKSSKFVLGTTQFGGSYGISSNKKLVKEEGLIKNIETDLCLDSIPRIN